MASKHLSQYQEKHLKSGEEIIANLKANAGKAMGKGHNKQVNNGELILTTNELVFYKKGLTGETKTAISLKNISSINTKSGMLTFDFVISSSGNDFHFNSTEKKEAAHFENKLNATINGTSESPQTKPTAPKKSGKLLKVGLAVFVVLMIIGALVDEPEQAAQTQTAESETKQSEPIKQLSPDDQKIQSIITQSKEYEILHSNDISNGSRSRWEAYIYAPKATTKDEQLATAAQAAKDIQVNNRVQYSWVILFDGRDSNTRNQLVGINFAPDGKDQAGNPMGGRFKIE